MTMTPRPTARLHRHRFLPARSQRAGTNFSQIGSLKNGATVKVESIANGWAKLENGGYVSAQYLAEVVDNGEAQTMYVTARTLNVRKGPGTSYAKVGTLSRGTAVQVVGFSGNWAKLSNGYYVSTSYLPSKSGAHTS